MMQLKMKTPEGDGGSVLLEGKLPMTIGRSENAGRWIGDR